VLPLEFEVMQLESEKTGLSAIQVAERRFGGMVSITTVAENMAPASLITCCRVLVY
jgi:hypothetical protein